MFSSTPIRLSPRFEWPVFVAGCTTREVAIPKWCRSPEGYLLTWDEHGEQSVVVSRRHGERVIVPKADLAVELRTPLADPALFMKLAQLPCVESAVLTFVAKYGYLDADARMWQRRKNARRSDDHDDDEWEERVGESFESWFRTVRLMKVAVRLWQASRSEGSISLKAIGIGREEQAALPTQLLKKARAIRVPKDALAVAHAIALEEINKAGHLSPGLAWSFSEALPHRRHVLEITPESLEVGLWLQFATAMAADAHYRECENCGGFFDAETTRRSRRYCSDSCKTRAYNKRHALATEPRSASKRKA
jgi:hypothetical protein